MDAPGPWATGSFTLVEGTSNISAEQVIINLNPFACVWLQREERTPVVRLAANPNYWNKDRGPRLREVVFRNDIAPQRALELVCDGEGEVDIVTEVAPADASRVQASEYARLVTINAHRAIAGVINRDKPDLPFNDPKARLALNLAVDRDALVERALFGHGSPLAGLSPYSAVSLLHRTAPYPHDPARAKALWTEAGGTFTRPLRLAAPDDLETIAWQTAKQITDSLGVETDVIIYRGVEERLEARRKLAAKQEPLEWDIFLHMQGGQSIDAPPLEMHRAFVGVSGEFRAGPVLPEFERLYADLVAQTAPPKQIEASHRIDKFVHDEALVLSLCAPHALYAVNKHVDFTPYSTTFELAECEVDAKHWSRR